MADLHKPGIRAEPEYELTNADCGIGGADEGVGIQAAERDQNVRPPIAATEFGEEPQGNGEIFGGVRAGLSLMRKCDTLVNNGVEEKGNRADEENEQREERRAPPVTGAKILAHWTSSVK